MEETPETDRQSTHEPQLGRVQQSCLQTSMQLSKSEISFCICFCICDPTPGVAAHDACHSPAQNRESPLVHPPPDSFMPWGLLIKEDRLQYSVTAIKLSQSLHCGRQWNRFEIQRYCAAPTPQRVTSLSNPTLHAELWTQAASIARLLLSTVLDCTSLRVHYIQTPSTHLPRLESASQGENKSPARRCRRIQIPATHGPDDRSARVPFRYSAWL